MLVQISFFCLENLVVGVEKHKWPVQNMNFSASLQCFRWEEAYLLDNTNWTFTIKFLTNSVAEERSHMNGLFPKSSLNSWMFIIHRLGTESVFKLWRSLTYITCSLIEIKLNRFKVLRNILQVTQFMEHQLS